VETAVPVTLALALTVTVDRCPTLNSTIHGYAHASPDYHTMSNDYTFQTGIFYDLICCVGIIVC